MPSGRFLLFVVLIAAAGAAIAAYLFPMVKKWWLKYQHSIEARNKRVEDEIDELYDDDEEDEKTYY